MLMTYYGFCGLAAVLLVSMQSFCGIFLLTPRDVGGTLFGGMFLDFMCLGGWLLATFGLVVTILLRSVGARMALTCSSAVQGGVGVWWLLNYPDDANGNLIFSPAPDDIQSMLFVIGLLLFGSFFLILKGYLQPKNELFHLENSR